MDTANPQPPRCWLQRGQWEQWPVMGPKGGSCLFLMGSKEPVQLLICRGTQLHHFSLNFH